MVVAVLQEVETTFLVHVYSTEATIITILAASQAVAIVLFYMQLKEEPGSMKLFVLVPVMFLSALLIALLASLG